MKNFIFTYLLLGFVLTGFSQDQTVGLFENDYRSFNGYTLFSPMRTGETYLIDNCGFVVNSWSSPYRPNLAVYLLDNGNLLQTSNTNSIAGTGGRLEIMDWDGNLVWSYNFPDSLYEFHHDIEPLPNGNILVISADPYDPVEAVQAGRDPSNLEAVLKSEKIMEIKPIGTDSMSIVWEWKAWDHLVQDFNAAKDNYGVVSDHPELLNVNYSASNGSNANIDWIHFNGVDYNADLDQIILCSRNLCEIYIIDHSTTTAEAASHSGGIYGKGGDILYRFGNPEAYDRGTIADRRCFFQHDAEWIEAGNPDEGKIMFFNNQVAADTSAVCMFMPPQDSAGYYTSPGSGAYEPDGFVWEYISPDIYAPRISSAQQMPNGNIVICAGTYGQFREVNKNKERLWKYVNPVSSNGPVNQGEEAVLNNAFKIRRYAPNFTGFAGHELIPGDPVELNPWPSTCNIATDTIIHLDLKVYLEGPFNGTDMNTSNNYLPLKQPFMDSPLNYFGTEAVQDLPLPQIVDWVYFELRDASQPDSATGVRTIMRQAGFLLNNGSIVGLDGVSKPVFYNSFIKDLYAVIYQRNHLEILSANPLEMEASDYHYDFTTDPGKTFGDASSCIELTPNVWGMIAGDSNLDRSINLNDKTDDWDPEAGESGYLPGDLNNDGQVDNEDKDDYLLKNTGFSSSVPE